MVLLTGASGYLGGHVLRLLAEKGIPVTAIAHRHPVTVSGKAIDTVSLDLANRKELAQLVDRVAPSTVIHLAARLSDGNRPGTMSDNVVFTRNLLDACAAAPVDRFVLASTISVYPARPADGVAHFENDPLAPRGAYGVSKHRAEILAGQWAEQNDRIAVVLRFSGIHGPPRRSGVVHRFAKAAASGMPLRVNEPDAAFSFLFVDDAARATLRAIDVPLEKGTHIFNISGEETLSLAELARRAVAASGSCSAVLQGIAPPRISVLAIDKSKLILGFTPTGTDNALRRLIDMYSER